MTPDFTDSVGESCELSSGVFPRLSHVCTCVLAVHMRARELPSFVSNTKVAAVTKMSVFAFVSSCVASVLQHGPPASSGSTFQGGIRGFQ